MGSPIQPQHSKTPPLLPPRPGNHCRAGAGRAARLAAVPPPDDLRNLVRLVLAKSNEAEVAARADNRVKLITQYSPASTTAAGKWRWKTSSLT